MKNVVCYQYYNSSDPDIRFMIELVFDHSVRFTTNYIPSLTPQ